MELNGHFLLISRANLTVPYCFTWNLNHERNTQPKSASPLHTPQLNPGSFKHKARSLPLCHREGSREGEKGFLLIFLLKKLCIPASSCQPSSACTGTRGGPSCPPSSVRARRRAASIPRCGRSSRSPLWSPPRGS